MRPQTPNILTDSEPPIKRLIWMPIRDAPDPPNPLNGRGGAKYLAGGV